MGQELGGSTDTRRPQLRTCPPALGLDGPLRLQEGSRATPSPEAGLFSKGSSHRGWAAADCEPAVRRVSPWVLKGILGSQAHHTLQAQSQTTAMRGIFSECRAWQLNYTTRVMPCAGNTVLYHWPHEEICPERSSWGNLAHLPTDLLAAPDRERVCLHASSKVTLPLPPTHPSEQGPAHRARPKGQIQTAGGSHRPSCNGTQACPVVQEGPQKRPTK